MRWYSKFSDICAGTQNLVIFALVPPPSILLRGTFKLLRASEFGHKRVGLSGALRARHVLKCEGAGSIELPKGHVKIIFLPVIALSFSNFCPKLEQTLHKHQEQHS